MRARARVRVCARARACVRACASERAQDARYRTVVLGRRHRQMRAGGCVCVCVGGGGGDVTCEDGGDVGGL